METILWKTKPHVNIFSWICHSSFQIGGLEIHAPDVLWSMWPCNFWIESKYSQHCCLFVANLEWAPVQWGASPRDRKERRQRHGSLWWGREYIWNQIPPERHLEGQWEVVICWFQVLFPVDSAWSFLIWAFNGWRHPYGWKTLLLSSQLTSTTLIVGWEFCFGSQYQATSFWLLVFILLENHNAF